MNKTMKIPETLHSDLDIVASVRGRLIGDLAESILQEWLDANTTEVERAAQLARREATKAA